METDGQRFFGIAIMSVTIMFSLYVFIRMIWTNNAQRDKNLSATESNFQVLFDALRNEMPKEEIIIENFRVRTIKNKFFVVYLSERRLLDSTLLELSKVLEISPLELFAMYKQSKGHKETFFLSCFNVVTQMVFDSQEDAQEFIDGNILTIFLTRKLLQ